jgi:hypothetical protein
LSAGRAWVGDQAAVGDRVGRDRLFKQALEEHSATPRVPAVETERELVGVCVEMLGADPALVGAEQPALEQARDAMHTWHHDVRRVVLLAHHGSLVRVAVLGDGPVRLPPIGVDSRAGLNDRLDERDQAVLVRRRRPSAAESVRNPWAA